MTRPAVTRPCLTGCTCNWGGPSENERLDNVLALLRHSASYRDQTPGRGGITGLDHALRTAGMAREHPFHTDSVFIGLVHDLARPLNDVHHGEVIAWMVKDRVTDLAFHVLRTHGEYQSAIVHGHQPPRLRYDIHRAASQLAGFELRSFAADYDGPAFTVPEAEELIRTYLHG